MQNKVYWACDDTKVECAPVCLATQGLVTNRVADARCAAEPKDACACAEKCYYDVRWECADDGSVSFFGLSSERAQSPPANRLCRDLQGR